MNAAEKLAEILGWEWPAAQEPPLVSGVELTAECLEELKTVHGLELVQIRRTPASKKLDAIRKLHVRDQDGAWTCWDEDCKKCVDGDGEHRGPICEYCSFSTDDDAIPSVVFWPCPTVQIIDDLPAAGLRAVQ